MKEQIKAGAAAMLLALPGVAGALAATGSELSPEQVFARVATAVVTVRGFDDHGTELAQGSGVVVAPAQVATNCHVIRDASLIRVETTASSAAAEPANHAARAAAPGLVSQWTRQDATRDVCLLSVDGLGARPVPLRQADSLVVGERVLAIGNPLGFGVSSSAGLIVATQMADGQARLVTSAAVSPGSSGGGLFDLQGRLIGLTTAILGTGQRLNLVLSADGIDQLQAHGRRPAPGEALPAPEPRRLADGDSFTLAADWPALEAHARRWIAAQPTSAPAHVALARALSETDRHPQASAELAAALELDPYYASAWYQKAVLLDARGDRRAAEEALARSLELLPSAAVPRRIEAHWLLQANRLQEAREVALLAVRLDAGNAGGWSTLGAIDDALGHHADAAHAYRVALRLGEPDPELQQKIARSLAHEGQTEAARSGALSQGAALSQAETWHTIGSGELTRGRLGAAQDAFRKALELAPEYAPAWSDLGTTLTRLDRLADAEKAYDKALQFDPKNAKARANRANVRRSLGQLPAALEDARQATRDAPQEAHAWRVYGLISSEQRNYPETVVAFSKLDELGSATPDDLASLGEGLAAVGKLPEALAALHRAEKENPNLPRLQIVIAKVLGNSGDIAGALGYLDRAVAAEPGNAIAWSSKGYALMRLGRLPEGAEALETAVRLAPDLVNAWINLGETRLRQGQLGRAIEALEKAVALNPEALDGRLYLAQSYLGSRQAAKAREHSTAVLARQPDQAAGLGILTMAYLMEGNETAAAQPYARLRAINPNAARTLKAQATRAGLSLAAHLPD
ncbi:serine protease [Candidatus Accumulibacter sp. ACC003]|uniref:tetratricopeptide repeat protein n=1 Tax=Candidatus Accumulibacter sp. ACC003 TaxID=2823334 RepID=UPI0025BDD79A|nr:serine protease [Candidatus Accumulibacter sp. ACC003]